MLKKLIISMMVLMSVVMIAPVNVQADTCKYSHCSRKATPGPNRDGYCYEHSPKNKAVKCRQSGCTRNAYHGSTYCDMHECDVISCRSPKMSGVRVCSAHKSKLRNYYSNSTKKTTNSSSKKKTYGQDSYDKGYEDVWLDDDYDSDRYYKDDDYARGVDDAMDDEDW